MLAIRAISIPRNLVCSQPFHADKLLKRLGAYLSERQIAHIRKYRQPGQKCLRLLARKAALEMAGFKSILDMDAMQNPSFPQCPSISVAFAYEGEYAFCAFYKSAAGSAAKIALDVTSALCDAKRRQAMIRWFDKCLPMAQQKTILAQANSESILKLWLLQECCTKMTGALNSLQATPRLFSRLFDESLSEKDGLFYARFINKASFYICLASSENIFNFNEPD